MKTYTGEALPPMAAAPGNPAGRAADDDVTFNGAVIVTKGQFYNPVYLAAIDAGCAQPKPAKAAQTGEPK